MIKVKIFTLLRIYLGIDEIDIEADKIDVRTLLNRICEKIDNNLILDKLIAKDGSMLPGTVILLNGHDIFFKEKLNTIVNGSDVVSLFPPGAGG